jgi:cellulose synthase/poly-beta-1,6-N-acetylglucosamine synthase-like glycosyltransferase
MTTDPQRAGRGFSRPAVSVVIPCHTMQRYEQLLRAVASVRDGSVPAQVLVVVDNNDQMFAQLVEDLGSAVEVLTNTGRGASHARNTALAFATGEIVAFIDDDAYAEPDWLEQLLAVFAHGSHVQGVGGRIVPNYGPRSRALPDEFLWVVGCTYRGHPTTQQAITRPIGCNMAFRRSAINGVGAASGNRFTH